MRVPCFEGLYPLTGCGVMSDGGNRRVGLATRSGVRPRAAMRAVHGVLTPVSRSSFFGKVPRVKYAGFTRQALHPLQAGIMSSNALTILPSGYWAPRTMVDFAA